MPRTKAEIVTSIVEHLFLHDEAKKQNYFTQNGSTVNTDLLLDICKRLQLFPTHTDKLSLAKFIVTSNGVRWDNSCWSAGSTPSTPR